MSSMLRFQTVGLKTVLLKLCVSIYAMIMLGKKSALFVLITVPWVSTDHCLAIKLKRIFLED